MKARDNITISLDEIKAAFQDLILERKTREEIADWATHLQKAEDDGKLFYQPKNEEDRIWDAISYLTGVDLTVGSPGSPISYFHVKADFEDYIKEEGLS